MCLCLPPMNCVVLGVGRLSVLAICGNKLDVSGPLHPVRYILVCQYTCGILMSPMLQM